MRIALAPVLAASLLLSTGAAAATADGGAAASVPVAQATLEAARAALAAALKRIEVDPPATADLDAAHEAVGALKDAIDFGAAQEPNDLDYARAALAARRELREKRDSVDARRAKVHLFNHRRTIDAALATLKEKAKAVEAKEPGAEAFEAVRAAVKAVRQAAAEGKPFAAQDPAFGSSLAEVEAQVARLEKATDEKWALLEGDKHRARVEEARGAFTQASSPLTARSSDPEFRAAESAAAALQQRLDEGKALEGGDKGYAAFATKTRAELATARKKLDELWSASGPERLKAELEPTAKDLAAVAKTLRGRKPTAEQLDEARTVAIVVRKLLEKFEPETKRSAALAQYVEGLRGTLAEVEGNLQLRALDLAVRDLRQALQKLERKAPSDDDFAVANSSLLVLEKTLAPMNARNPLLAGPVDDGRTWLREGKATIGKRRTELDVAAQQALVETARQSATLALDAFTRPTSAADDVRAAEAAVANVAAALEKGAELTKRDREYAAYDREVKKRITEFNKKIDTRKLFLTAQDARTQLGELNAAAKDRIAATRAPAGTDADLDAATKAVEQLTAFLDAKAELEAQAGSYASAAERGRLELIKRMEALEVARQERELRKRTIDAYAAGAAAFAAAEGSQDLRVQKASYEKALAGFRTCKEEGARALEANPVNGRLAVVLDGRPGTLKEVATLCAQRFDQASPLIKPLAGLIAFDDGPKRAFEAASALLAQGKKQEALAEFDECTATGLMVQQRHPDLKERRFQLQGAARTLVELTRECTAQSKALRGK